MSEAICLKKQLTQDEAEQDLNFDERACELAGCALRFYMADNERFPRIAEGFDATKQQIVFGTEWSEPLSGVAIEGSCKTEKDFWLNSTC